MTIPTIDQLKRGVAITGQIAALEKELAGILGNHSIPAAPAAKSAQASAMAGKFKRSPATIARMKAAQRARWAKIKGKKAPVAAKAPVKKKFKMSAQGLANIIAAQKKRWAKIKAGKKTQPAKAKAKAPAANVEAPAKKKRTPMSAEAKAKLSAMMKARWDAKKAAKAPAAETKTE